MPISTGINALLASLMISCLVVSAGRVAGSLQTAAVSGEGENILLAALAFLVSLEVQLTRRVLSARSFFSRGWIRNTLVEWTLLLLGMIAVVWLRQGWAFALHEIRSLPDGLQTVFAKVEYLQAGLALALAWGCSRLLTGELIALEEEPGPAPKETVIDPMGAQLRARDRLWEHTFLFGGAIILCSIILPPILREQLGLAPLPAALGWEVPVYFLCALILLTIARLLLLRADWAWERTPIRPGLSRHWMMYSLAFLSVIILLAAILPTDITGGLLASLQAVLRGIGEIFLIIGGLIYAFIVMPLFGLLGRVFSLSSTSEKVVPATPELPDLAPAGQPPIDWSWLPALRELLLWIVIIAVLIFVFRELLRGRPVLFRGLLRFPAGRWLVRFWQTLWRRMGGFPHGILSAARRAFQNAGMSVAVRTGRMDLSFLRLRDLNDQARIRFYFLALIRRGTERGFPRKPSQTPREYTEGLEEANPPICGELQELVLAFEDARYSGHPPEHGRARRVQQVWDLIRSQIRKRKA
jgi:hypothetical protein